MLMNHLCENIALHVLGSDMALHAYQHALCGETSPIIGKQLSNYLSSVQSHCRLPSAAVRSAVQPLTNIMLCLEIAVCISVRGLSASQQLRTNHATAPLSSSTNRMLDVAGI